MCCDRGSKQQPEITGPNLVDLPIPKHISVLTSIMTTSPGSPGRKRPTKRRRTSRKATSTSGGSYFDFSPPPSPPREVVGGLTRLSALGSPYKSPPMRRPPVMRKGVTGPRPRLPTIAWSYPSSPSPTASPAARPAAGFLSPSSHSSSLFSFSNSPLPATPISSPLSHGASPGSVPAEDDTDGLHSDLFRDPPDVGAYSEYAHAAIYKYAGFFRIEEGWWVVQGWNVERKKATVGHTLSYHTHLKAYSYAITASLVPFSGYPATGRHCCRMSMPPGEKIQPDMRSRALLQRVRSLSGRAIRKRSVDWHYMRCKGSDQAQISIPSLYFEKRLHLSNFALVSP